jgi:hypothetical protein
LNPDIKNRNVFGSLHDTQTNQENRNRGNGISEMHGKAARGAETEAAAEGVKAGTGSNKKKSFGLTAKYPAFAKRGKRVQAFFCLSLADPRPSPCGAARECLPG